MITRLGVATVLTLAAASTAGADVQVSTMKFGAPSGFQETAFADGKVVLDPSSDLKVVIYIVKKATSLDDAAKKVVASLPSSTLRLAGAPIKAIAYVKSNDSESRGAKQRWGKATVDGKGAQFAILQREGDTLFLAGISDTDAGKAAFASMVSKLEPAASAATDDAEPLPRLGSFIALEKATASSTYPDKAKKDSYAAWRILDFDTVDNAGLEVPPNAWCEGKPDEGIGENVTLSLAAPTNVDELKIATGVWLNQKLFDSNNRITALSVSIDGAAPIKVSPPAKREWVTVKVGKAISSIKLTIDGVAKGKMNDSCISGVELVVDGEVPSVARIDATALAALPAFYAAIQKSLSDPARTGLDALVAFPFSYALSDWFLDGSNRKTQKFANAKALAAACKKSSPTCPSGPNTGGRDEAASVSSPGANLLTVRFSSRREVIDVWHLAWKGGAWKLVSADYESP